MTRPFCRRRFLRQTTLSAAALTILPTGLWRSYAANERLDIAFIGTGGQGGTNLAALQREGQNIVALCDVDRRALAGAAAKHPRAQRWADFRRMLEGQKNIDAVVVSTPDHTHAVASMMAMKLGKHVCTEKPLTHSIYEARRLAEVARESKVATQLDNEGHAGDRFRSLVEWLRNGVVGPIREVHVWSDRPIWAQGIERPKAAPVPDHLDWDLWLGPAPFRPHHFGLHPFAWRGFWDFGTGALGDMGCHLFDAAFWGLELGHPEWVEARSEGNNEETGPRWSVVTYQFPARPGKRPSLRLTWHDGGRQPAPPEGWNKPMPKNGSLFQGEKGSIVVEGVGRATLLPESFARSFEPPKPFLPRVTSHKAEWLTACRGGPASSDNFADYGGALTEVVLLGNVAIRTGQRIEWDPAGLKARNTAKADPFIRRPYRSGWEL